MFPWLPKSSGVATIPTPKNCCHNLFTVTLDVKGLSLSKNHFDKPILLEGYLLSSNSNTALGVLGLTSLVGES